MRLNRVKTLILLPLAAMLLTGGNAIAQEG